MKKIVFTEEFCKPENLFPFTLTKQIQDLRVGILTIREKWEKILSMPSFDKKEDDYKDLSRSLHLDQIGEKDICFLLHGNILPTKELVSAILKLKNGQCLTTKDGNSIAYRITKKEIKSRHKIQVTAHQIFDSPIVAINFPWDILQINDWAIREDFTLLTKGRKSAKIPAGTKAINPKQVFIERGASISHAVINAKEGPVYIGKNAVIMEGSLIRGPFAIGESGCVKMGAKVYGATSLGPKCTVGGELKNVIFFGYSNKAHDGYLGDSVIGEWCNMGAGTSNSNLKNNAKTIKVWTPDGEKSVGNKFGTLVGDYTRTAINTSINTGTVIGVSCNVFGNGLTPGYVPSFSWGSEGVERYKQENAIEDIAAWKLLKGEKITEEESFILRTIYKNY